mgnify:CR=1 FL=1
MVWFREHVLWLVVIIAFVWIYRRVLDRRSNRLQAQRNTLRVNQSEPETE